MQRALGSRSAECLRLPSLAWAEGLAWEPMSASPLPRPLWASEDPELLCLSGPWPQPNGLLHKESQQILRLKPLWVTRSQVAFGVEKMAQISSARLDSLRLLPSSLSGLLKTSVFPM